MHFSLKVVAFFVTTFFFLSTNAQCLIGTIGASGAGCGCLSGCNLTAFGGPNCGSGVGGNCVGGVQNLNMEWVLPATCGVRVEARMANRPGCTASGADSGDRLKVEGDNPKPWQNGASNSTLFDSHSQVGGTIGVYAQANRRDEIVSYELFFESGACPFCILLPVELVSFNAFAEGHYLWLNWETYTERENKGWYIEHSSDGLHWEQEGFVPGAGTSAILKSYEQHLLLPESGVHYYRLRQEDVNGTQGLTPVVSFEVVGKPEFEALALGKGKFRLLGVEQSERLKTIDVLDLSGRCVFSWKGNLSEQVDFSLAAPEGLYLVLLRDELRGTQSTSKLLLR